MPNIFERGLIDAAKTGSITAAEQALANTACNINVVDDDTDPLETGERLGSTPLHYAVRHGHVAMVDFLLRHGANPNATNRYGQTALHIAAATQMDDTSTHAPSTSSSSSAPTSSTAPAGGTEAQENELLDSPQVQIGKLLINAGAAIESMTFRPMQWPTRPHSENTFVDGTALHFAAIFGYMDFIKLLLDAGANHKSLNRHNMTPADIATVTEHLRQNPKLAFVHGYWNHWRGGPVQGIFRYQDTDERCCDTRRGAPVTGLDIAHPSNAHKLPIPTFQPDVRDYRDYDEIARFITNYYRQLKRGLLRVNVEEKLRENALQRTEIATKDRQIQSLTLSNNILYGRLNRQQSVSPELKFALGAASAFLLIMLLVYEDSLTMKKAAICFGLSVIVGSFFHSGAKEYKQLKGVADGVVKRVEETIVAGRDAIIAGTNTIQTIEAAIQELSHVTGEFIVEVQEFTRDGRHTLKSIQGDSHLIARALADGIREGRFKPDVMVDVHHNTARASLVEIMQGCTVM